MAFTATKCPQGSSHDLIGSLSDSRWWFVTTRCLEEVCLSNAGTQPQNLNAVRPVLFADCVGERENESFRSCIGRHERNRLKRGGGSNVDNRSLLSTAHRCQKEISQLNQ